MRLAGQSCISVQAVRVHRSLYESFVTAVVENVRRLKVGDPLAPETDVGTLIDEGAGRRIETWVGEAVAAGARVLTGGTRSGAQCAPTVLVEVAPTMKVVCDDVFGPVVSILPYDDIQAVFRTVSESRYGLLCGIS